MRPPVGKVLAELARSSHGVVMRGRLLKAGVTNAQIKRLLGSGVLLREYPGVYRVGHRAPNPEATYLAAVWACGPGALLCGLAAAHLYGILKGAAPPPHVVAPTKRRIEGVKTHRSLRLDPREATNWRGIPITTVPRTLVGIAPDLGVDRLARACHEAGVRYGTAPRDVDAVLARWPNAPGAGKLKRVLRGEVHVTLSKLESRFLERLRKAGLLLPPETNRPAGGHRVDCRWPEHGLTVELDSYRYHNSRYSWEQDRRREREARARGDEFRRYTPYDVFENPAPMIAELRALLSKLGSQRATER